MNTKKQKFKHHFLLAALSALGLLFGNNPGQASAQDSALLCKRVLLNRLDKNNFAVDRPLRHYLSYFGQPFADDLLQLGPLDHLIEQGAGHCRAVVDILTSKIDLFGQPWPLHRRPKITAITYKIDDRSFLDGPYPFPIDDLHDRLTVLEGRLFEDIPISEIVNRFGRPRIIVDCFGVLSYTTDIAKVLEKDANLLGEGGILYIRTARSAHSNATHVQTGDQSVTLLEWLTTLPGFRSEIVPGKDDVIRMVRTAEPFTMPQMKLELFADDYPPERRFRVVSPALTPAPYTICSDNL